MLGYDAYKDCIDEAVATARELGPVLGAYHPCVLDVLTRLKADLRAGRGELPHERHRGRHAGRAVGALSHETKKRLVRFAGAYHGWWEDVQPGPGNPLPPRETFTLQDMAERSLKVLATRRDIACVLVNPLQALHPNVNAPGDSALIDGSRRASYDREAYTAWLKKLREVCTARGIVLIFDEVFVGFPPGTRRRAAVLRRQGRPRHLRQDAGRRAAGGRRLRQPRALMTRYREDRPADICFARGTFNAHPYVMAAMAAFLKRIERPEVKALYDGLDERWNAPLQRSSTRGFKAGRRPGARGQPVDDLDGAVHQPGRYHWMLQFYLRKHGLALSWVGTGRLIFSLNYGDAEFAEVMDRFVAACDEMRADGWWWTAPELTAKAIRRSVFREMLGQKF